MPQATRFKGYSEDQMKRIASKLGHTGGLDTFDTYLTSNQNALSKYNALKDNIKKMYAGGYVNKYAGGGDVRSDLLSTGLTHLGLRLNARKYFPDTEKPPAMQTADMQSYTNPFTGQQQTGSSSYASWLNSMATKYGTDGNYGTTTGSPITAQPNNPLTPRAVATTQVGTPSTPIAGGYVPPAADTKVNPW